MARISILLTETMIQSFERIQRVQPFSSRAAVMSAALEAGLISLSSAMPTVTSKARRRVPKEPAERFDQALDARNDAAVDAPDMSASRPEVTAVTAAPDDSEAYLERLSSSPGEATANPFG